MKFVLKDELIHIVGNHGLANNKVEGSVEAPGLDGFALSYSINGKPFKSLGNKLILSEKELKNPSIKITVKGVKGEDIVYFKSDDIPLTHAIIFGDKLEDKYPEALKYVLKEIKKVKEFVGITKEELNKNMLDMVQTFEEIIQKGSLF